MSQNFFAALDDSGDEAPAPIKDNAKKREPKNANKKAVAATKGAVEPSKQENRRRPNNDRNTKQGRGGRNPPRDGKRAYDRRSGTGRGKEIKKGGGGARNWGSDKAEAKKMEGKIDEEEVKDDQIVAPVEGGEPAAEEPAPEEESKPEDKTMTLADYMASKGKKEDNAGREVESEFTGVTASKKEEEDFLVMGGSKTKKTKKKKDDQKKVVDVGFRTANPNSGRGGRGRGDRGGRGGRGNRDGRGRGRGRGGRGPKNQNAGINVQDEAAFPSL